MERYFKLNKPVYGKTDHIRVTNKYDKREGGYIAYVELVIREVSNMFGKVFCKEYFEIGDGCYLLAPVGRRSKKKESETADIVRERAREFAEMYLSHINVDGIEIVEEV